MTNLYVTALGEAPPPPFFGDDDGAFLRPSDINVTAAFRAHMESNAPLHVCAVCSTMVPDASLLSLPLNRVPNIRLLRADIPKTPELPRDAHTVYTSKGTTYCLQPDAVHPPRLSRWSPTDSTTMFTEGLCALVVSFKHGANTMIQAVMKMFTTLNHVARLLLPFDRKLREGE